MNNYYLFAETAFIHEGDIIYLRKLIDAVANSPAKGIKFQVLTNANDFLSRYNVDYEALEAYCFSKEDWCEIINYAQEMGLDIIMMPLNAEALTLCKEFDFKYLEIHSVSQNDIRLKEAVKQTGVDLIITTGGRFELEIDADLDFFKDQVAVLMVGFQSFPSHLQDVRLGQISYWKNKYANVKIGYADHSAFDDENALISLNYALLLGATVFEKHVAVTEGAERVDYSAAISTEKLITIDEGLHFLSEHILADTIALRPMLLKEEKYRKRQLICVAAQNLAEGSVLSINDVKLKMYHDDTGTFESGDLLVGKKLLAPVKADQPFLRDQIES